MNDQVNNMVSPCCGEPMSAECGHCPECKEPCYPIETTSCFYCEEPTTSLICDSCMEKQIFKED